MHGAFFTFDCVDTADYSLSFQVLVGVGRISLIDPILTASESNMAGVWSLSLGAAGSPCPYILEFDIVKVALSVGAFREMNEPLDSRE